MILRSTTVLINLSYNILVASRPSFLQIQFNCLSYFFRFLIFFIGFVKLTLRSPPGR